MRRRLKLSFEEFGWEALVTQAEREHETLDQLLAYACAYLESELGSGRYATRLPRFKPRARGTIREISIELGNDSWERLERMADDEGVALENVIEHAAFVYLADVESGRAAEVALRRAEPEGGPTE
jgi:predicted DNA-binding ribbon-helix-helix protein